MPKKKQKRMSEDEQKKLQLQFLDAMVMQTKGELAYMDSMRHFATKAEEREWVQTIGQEHDKAKKRLEKLDETIRQLKSEIGENP